LNCAIAKTLIHLQDHFRDFVWK